MDWLSKRPATTSVRTVDEVMGGEFKPVVGQPLARVISAAEGPTADDQPVTKALSKVPAWTVFGYGIGQSQLIATGLIVALTIVFTYRLATRGNRYGR